MRGEKTRLRNLELKNLRVKNFWEYIRVKKIWFNRYMAHIYKYLFVSFHPNFQHLRT